MDSKSRAKIFLVSLLGGLTLAWPALAEPAGTLSLDGFLGEVRHDGLGIRAQTVGSAAALGRSREADLLYAPQLVGQAGWLDDKKRTLAPLLYGSETRMDFYSLGVEKQTSTGTKARLTTGVSYFSLTGANPALIPQPAFYSGFQQLEITQSLLRNGFGSETRAQEEAVRAQAKAEALNGSYQAKALVATAEIDYWRLAAARQAVQVRRDALDRAKRLERWSAGRRERGLGHESDLYQAKSAVRMAELELQSALDEERAAAWNFNSDRGKSSPTVDEALEPLDPANVADIRAPRRSGPSDGVKAAEQASKAAEAKALLEVEKIRPSLDVYGTAILNGKNPQGGAAYNGSFSTANPTLAAGVKLVVPLDFGLVSELKQASLKEKEAADLRFRQARFDEDRQWNDLALRLEETRRKLAIASEIESLQRDKSQNERRQHGLGMTTTYQVLTFEDDYAKAHLNRLELHAELLAIVAKMKIFGGAQ